MKALKSTAFLNKVEEVIRNTIKDVSKEHQQETLALIEKYFESLGTQNEIIDISREDLTTSVSESIDEVEEPINDGSFLQEYTEELDEKLSTFEDKLDEIIAEINSKNEESSNEELSSNLEKLRRSVNYGTYKIDGLDKKVDNLSKEVKDLKDTKVTSNIPVDEEPEEEPVNTPSTTVLEAEPSEKVKAEKEQDRKEFNTAVERTVQEVRRNTEEVKSSNKSLSDRIKDWYEKGVEKLQNFLTKLPVYFVIFAGILRGLVALFPEIPQKLQEWWDTHAAPAIEEIKNVDWAKLLGTLKDWLKSAFELVIFYIKKYGNQIILFVSELGYATKSWGNFLRFTWTKVIGLFHSVVTGIYRLLSKIPGLGSMSKIADDLDKRFEEAKKEARESESDNTLIGSRDVYKMEYEKAQKEQKANNAKESTLLDEFNQKTQELDTVAEPLKQAVKTVATGTEGEEKQEETIEEPEQVENKSDNTQYSPLLQDFDRTREENKLPLVATTNINNSNVNIYTVNQVKQDTNVDYC